jgi:protein phosphatase
VILRLPPGALVVLVGVSGAGKSTFAAAHFRPTQVLSSDAMRAMVADDPTDQSATEPAFELLHTLLDLRLARGRLSVIDATNVEQWARALLLEVARRHRRPAVAIVMDLPLELCLARNAARSDRDVPAAAVRRQSAALSRSIATLADEGFGRVWRLDSLEAVSAASVELVEDGADSA